MRLKKVISIFLSMLMVMGLVLSGCGNSSGGGETKAPQSKAPEPKAADTQAAKTDEPKAAEKIVIFISKVEIQDALQEMADTYKEETGNEIEIWGTTGDDYLQQLKTKLANNQGPTIFSTAGGSEIEQLKGYAADLGSLNWLGDFADGFVQTVDGAKLGVPSTVEGFGLVYNKDLIDATALKSTDDFVNMLKEQKANGIEGFELSSETYFLIGHILNTPFALQSDPDQYVVDLAEGKVKMSENDIFKEFAQMMVSIRENCQNPLEQNYDGEIGDLATGKAASIHQGNWCAGMFADYGDVNIGLAPLPLAGNDKLAVSVPFYFSINSEVSAEEQEAGLQFLTWLYTTETGKDYLYNKFGFIPLIKGDTSDSIDVLSADVQKYVQDGKTIGWPNSKWPASIVDVYLAPLTQEFFTSQMTADEFVQKLDLVWAEAVANQAN